MTLSPNLRAIQAEAAPHMARCGTLTVHSTWHDRVFGSHTRPEFDDVVVPRVRRADPHAARAALLRMGADDVAAGLERWIEVACRAAGCEPDALLGFGRGRGHMPRDTSAVRAAICEYARTFGLRYVDLAARFKASRSALLSAAKSQRDKRSRREVAA